METSKAYELYAKLKEMLNGEQQKILAKFMDEYQASEMADSEKSFKDGKMQGLKTAVKLIIGAMI